MKQQPSRIKYKKNHKPSILNLKLKHQKIFSCLNGIIGLKVIQNGYLSYNQIEACRKSVRRIMKKEGSL
jgi:ribosomal protein L16/L10AE